MGPGGDPDLEEDDPLKEDANFKKIKAFLNHDRHADKAFCVMISRTGELIVVHDRWESCYAWQLEDQKMPCLEGKCQDCGFAKYWTRGLRGKVVHPNGNLMEGIHPAWKREVMQPKIRTLCVGLRKECTRHMSEP